MNILITGASGYIGNYLSNYLYKKKEFNLFLINKKKHTRNKNKTNTFYLDINDKNIDWDIYLQKIDIVIHLAATQHKIFKNQKSNIYLSTNSNSVGKLIYHCIKNDVKKFIYLSSIKVNGEKTLKNTTFSYSDKPNPKTIYAKSKYLGEQELKKMFNNEKTEIYILRIPLVYGHKPKGYLSIFSNFIKKGYPIPLKGFKNNLRSYISIYNLNEFIYHVIKYNHNNTGVYLLSDKDDYSTYDFLYQFSKTITDKSKFIYIPKFIIKSILFLTFNNHIYERLNNSLRIDSQTTYKIFNWNPKYNLKDTIDIINNDIN